MQYMESGKIYEENYLSKDYTYTLYTSEYFGTEHDIAFLTTDQTIYSYEDGSYKRVLLLSPDGLTDAADYRAENDTVIILGSESVQETIQSVTKKDGRITVISSMEQENIDALGAGGLLSSDSEYVLDAKTRELIAAKNVTDYDDGTTYEISSEIFYDAEIPDGMNVFLEYEHQTEDLRTVTIVSNPGTGKEKSQSVQVPKGLSVSLESVLDTDEAFALYTDAACKEPFVSEDPDSDVTIYVTWGE